MTSGRKKPTFQNVPELSQDWYPNKPGMEVDKRLKKIMALTNTRQAKIIEMTEHSVDKIIEKNFSNIYAFKNNQWKHTGYRCLDCGKVFSDNKIVDKHPLVCEKTLKINNTEEQFILSRVKKNANKKD